MRKLLVIDLQKQFKDKNGCYENCLSFIKESNYVKKYATVFTQNLNGKINHNYKSKLNWNDCLYCSKDDLEFIADEIILKNGYGIKNIGSIFNKNDKIDVIGCNIDACVMAICFQLWDMGIDFRILTDYVYTTSKDFSKNDIIEIMKPNFGKCII